MGDTRHLTRIAIDPSNPLTIYVGTYDSGGGIYKSINGGENWISVYTAQPGEIYSILDFVPTTPLTIFANAEGDLIKSTNGGTDWSVINNGLSNTDIRSLTSAPSNPETVFAGTYKNGVFKTTNSGASWSAINTGLTNKSISSLAIDPSAPQTLFATSYYGNSIFKSINGGVSWVTMSTSLSDAWFNTLAIDPNTPQIVYAGTSNGDVYKSINGGESWNAINNGLALGSWTNALTIDKSSPMTIYAGSYGKGIYKSVNGGESWNAINDGLTNLWVLCVAIDPATPQTIYAGTNGKVFKSLNGGTSWGEASTGLGSRVYSLLIDPVNPKIIYAGTLAGVFMSVNGGDSWSTINTGLNHSVIYSLHMDSASPANIYAGSAQGGVFITADIIPPVITLTSAPSNYSNQASGTIIFSANETATFECKIDNGIFASCTSPFIYSELSDGQHTFTIQATDRAGNTSTVLSSFTTDTIAPTLSITYPSKDITTALSSVVFIGSIGVTTNQTTIAVTVDGHTYNPINSRDGNFEQSIPLTAAKIYLVVVTVTDQAGNSTTYQCNITKITPLIDPTINDALKVLKAFVGITSLTADEKVRYDVAPLGVNGIPLGNGSIDAADIILILRRSIGIGSW